MEFQLGHTDYGIHKFQLCAPVLSLRAGSALIHETRSAPAQASSRIAVTTCILKRQEPDNRFLLQLIEDVTKIPLFELLLYSSDHGVS